MARLVILALLAGFVLTARLAVLHLPWWGTLALALLALVLAPRLIGWLARRFFVGLFRAKGAPLRQARVQVHAITPAAPPAPAEDGEDSGPRSWYSLEVTIAPGGEASPFRMWEPGSLALARPGASADDSDDDSASVRQVEVWQEDRFVLDEGWKLEGPQRLRLLVGVAPGVERLRLRYYLESFGGTFRVRPPAARELAGAAAS